MHLTTLEIFFYAYALAFWWVNYFMRWLSRARSILWPCVCKPIRMKPFTCIKCMCGWLSLILALTSGNGWSSMLMMFGGIFIGAMAEGITMRYL